MAAGETPPAPWDEGVTRAVTQMTRVLERGIERIGVGRPGAPDELRAVFTRSTVQARRIDVEVGAREGLEVEGRLLMADFAASRDDARIHRPLDVPVRCRFGPELESVVLRLLRHYVRATGSAELDDQGRVKLFELESLEDAEMGGGRPFWELRRSRSLPASRGSSLSSDSRISSPASGPRMNR